MHLSVHMHAIQVDAAEEDSGEGDGEDPDKAILFKHQNISL